jgi:hypothetical protein
VAPDGTAYQATQHSIRGNHVAVVKKGRAGSECRIGDTATCAAAPEELLRVLLDHLIGDGRTYNPNDDGANLPPSRRETSNPGGEGALTQDGEVKMPHLLIIDGLQVPNVSDEAKAAIEKLQGNITVLTDAKAALETQVATLTTEKATLDAKVTTLEKQIEDSKVTPAQLRDAAKAYSEIITKAKALGVEVTDDMDDAAIMKAAAVGYLGDEAVKDWNDAQFAASFHTRAKDVKLGAQGSQLGEIIKDAAKPSTAAASVSSARAAWLADKQTAYRGQAAN